MFFRGAMAGAEVQRVVGVGPRSGSGEAALLGHRVQHREKLVFAVEAAVGGVRAVGRVFHLVRVDGFVIDSELTDKFVDRGAVISGKAWGKRGDGKRPP